MDSSQLDRTDAAVASALHLDAQDPIAGSVGSDESYQKAQKAPYTSLNAHHNGIAQTVDSSAGGKGSHRPSADTSQSGPHAAQHSAATAIGGGGFSSMTGAGQMLQQSSNVDALTMHPPGRAPTGGQSHGHRPVSAMPSPSTRTYYTPSRQAGHGEQSASSAGMNYPDRRASAHPTVPVSSAAPGGNHALPSADYVTSNAAGQGVPITSPAALQYFAAHPRRQQVHFGNYLLLQTLGEGEFGKVKLGVHKEWGEEVAVKLIKRDKVGTPDGQLQITGPSKDPSKMSKVEKEIRVLKDVRHPNIVRLYEVIESDRYIGIVLEYASGGELFDHILAHKYLKERDACRLFAQLISGVSYLHRKKIVHRDLKLENLLLDRNRNVIITDFGFANNFENKRDDLMATSCGSPCYAAPELVVQDGLYAGSAVDVWSCGVILYAMLAGYLPFDDDPANPDGDNINLLYKYIMATPLSFPDYITAQPRDLLSRMLVPDPLKRADLQMVMAHPWLSPYRDLFKFSVEELERAAIEQQNKKRQVYRQQIIMQQQMQEQQRQNGAARGQGQLSPASVKQQRHQSAIAVSSTVPDRIYEPSQPSARSRPVTGVPTPRDSVDTSAYSQHSSGVTINPGPSPSVREPMHDLSNADIASVRGAGASAVGSGAHSNGGSSGVSKKSAGSKTQRHTVQLEYDGSSRRGRDNHKAEPDNDSRAVPTGVADVHANAIAQPVQPSQSARVADQENLVNPVRSTSFASVPVGTAKTDSPVNRQTATGVAQNDRSRQASATIQTPSQKPVNGSADLPASSTEATITQPANTVISPSPSVSSANKHNRRRSTAASSRNASNPLPSASERDVAKAERVVSGGAGPWPEASSTHADSTMQRLPSASKSERAQARHKKGMSTDKFFFSKLLGSPPSSFVGSPTPSEVLQRPGGNRDTSKSDVPSPEPSIAGSRGRRTSNARRKAMSLVVGRATESDKGTSKSTVKPASRSRKDTLTNEQRLPETPTKRNVSGPSSVGMDAAVMSTPSGASVITNHSSASKSTTTFKRSNNNAGNLPFDHARNESSSTVGASSNAAKKVMDWFRKKSLSRGLVDEKPPLGTFDPHGTPRKTKVSGNGGSTMGTPQLIVTQETQANVANHENANVAGMESVPSSRSTSGTHSNSTHATNSTVATSAAEPTAFVQQPVSKASTTTVHQVSPNASQQQQSTPRASTTQRTTTSKAVPDSALRVHQGAVDQSALTSRLPRDVFDQVQRALWQMGIDAKKEGEDEFRLECVRRKRAKTLMSATQGLGLSIRTSVFPPSQADYERSASNAAAAARLPSSPSSMLSPSPSTVRNFLRRNSSQHSATNLYSSGSNGEEQMPPPLYGEPSVDGGQEVRFNVELTRLKNLPGLYSVDIRRMKGNLWAYKFIYHALLDRCDLSGNASANAAH